MMGSRGRRALRWVVVVGMVVFGSGAVATAQGSMDAIARAHFEAGSLYFERGDYGEAIAEFSRAYEISQRTELLYNLYLAYERDGQLANAIDALSRYLDAIGEIENRDTLTARLANLRRRASGTTAPSTEPTDGSEPRIDSDADTTTRDPDPSTDPDGDDPPASDSGRSRTPTFVALGVAGAGIASFGIAGGLALAKDRSLASSCGRDAGRTCSADEVAPLRRRTIAADVGAAIAVAGTATFVVLLLVDGDDDAPSSRLVPYFGYDGIVASAGVGGALR